MSIVESIKKFSSYLYGYKFDVLTDHKPLIHIKESDSTNIIENFRFDIIIEYDFSYIM